MLTNWLQAEQLIIDRLKEKVPEAKLVVGMPDFDVQIIGQKCPALVVIYQGDRMGGNAEHGAVQVVDQIWSVVVATRSAAKIEHGEASRAEAGDLLTKAIRSLSGWNPDQENFQSGLTRIQAGGAGYLSGISWFPLAFKISTYSIGAPDE